MRCVALAQAWQAVGGRVLFAMGECPVSLVERLGRDGIQTVPLEAQAGSDADATETAEAARRAGAHHMVVDGYAFDARYQAALGRAGLRTLFIDDYGHAAPYTADLVLNQNAYAGVELYTERAPKTRLLLGPRFALLRQEFRAWRNWRRPLPDQGRRILVTLGGSDPENVTLRTMEAFERLVDLEAEAIVLIGSGNPNASSITARAARQPRLTIRRDAADMPELMAWADIAVTAGGSTCYEAALLGLPSLVLALAENQRGVAESLSSLEVVEYLGWHREVSIEDMAARMRFLLLERSRRGALSAAGRRLISGDGAERVVEAMLTDAEPGSPWRR